MTTPDYAVLGFGTSPRSPSTTSRSQGQLPDWLEGSLIRNGPGTFRVGERRYRHWFDGLAMLHRFSFARRSGVLRQPFPGDAGLRRGP